MMNKIKSVLFDLDGVLVDTCDLHFEALNQALLLIAGRKAILTREEHESTFNALPTTTKLKLLVSQGRISIEDCEDVNILKQKITREMIPTLLDVDPVKVDMFKRIEKAKIRTACVTNCSTETALMMLGNTGQLSYLEFLVSNETVSNAKPSSEGYVQAMVRLRSEPRHTLIVEDSPKGLIAARNTGATVLEAHSCSSVNWDFIKDHL